MLFGAVLAGHNWLDWQKPKYRSELASIHERVLVEMRQRMFLSAFRHETPVPPDILQQALGPQQLKYPVTSEQLRTDRWDLLTRWKGVYKGRVYMPFEYMPLLRQYWSQGGCLHTTGIIDGNLCRTCKQVIA